MFEQMMILFFILVGTGFTLFLYVWKAKKQIEYKGDERWQLIQIKASHAANAANYILVLLLAVGDTILLFTKAEITITLNRVFLYGILFIALRNTIEAVALLCYDRQL